MPESISQIINYTNTGTPMTLNTVEESDDINLKTKTYIQQKKEIHQFQGSNKKPEQQQQLPVNLPSSQSSVLSSVSSIVEFSELEKQNADSQMIDDDENSFDRKPFQRNNKNSKQHQQIQFDESTPLLK